MIVNLNGEEYQKKFNNTLNILLNSTKNHTIMGEEFTYKGKYVDCKKHGYWEGYCNGELINKKYYYMGIEIHKTSKNKLIL